MNLPRALSALALVGLLAACGSAATEAASTGDPTTTTSTTSTTEAPTTTVPAETCSAAVLSNNATDDQPELAAPVADMRARVITAALACDYDELETLSLEGDGTFRYSFGATASEGSADYWREREAEGEEVIRLLVETLRLPHVEQDGATAWPSAHSATATDADWAAVVPLYGQEQIDAMRSGGSGFLGYRAAITAAGDWQFFLAGD